MEITVHYTFLGFITMGYNCSENIAAAVIQKIFKNKYPEFSKQFCTLPFLYNRYFQIFSKCRHSSILQNNLASNITSEDIVDNRSFKN